MHIGGDFDFSLTNKKKNTHTHSVTHSIEHTNTFTANDGGMSECV